MDYNMNPTYQAVEDEIQNFKKTAVHDLLKMPPDNASVNTLTSWYHKADALAAGLGRVEFSIRYRQGLVISLLHSYPEVAKHGSWLKWLKSQNIKTTAPARVYWLHWKTAACSPGWQCLSRLESGQRPHAHVPQGWRLPSL
jgi:hypothetical protein